MKKANEKRLPLFPFAPFPADNLFNRFENQQQYGGKGATFSGYDYDGGPHTVALATFADITQNGVVAAAPN